MFRQIVGWVRPFIETGVCANCGAIKDGNGNIYFLGAPAVSRVLPAVVELGYETIAGHNNERVVYYQMSAGRGGGTWLLVSHGRDGLYRIYSGSYGGCSECDDWLSVAEDPDARALLAQKYPPLAAFTALEALLLADSQFSRVMLHRSGGLDMAMAGAEVRGAVIFLENMQPMVTDIIAMRNAEIRHHLLQRLGYEAFLSSANGQVIDRRGQETLIAVGDLFFARVCCPSTGRWYLLRVPPCDHLEQAIAWTFFKDAHDYLPRVET